METKANNKNTDMKNRITPQTRAIAEAHIAASISGHFDDPKVNTRDEVINLLKQGKTFSQVLEQVETRFCTITSILYRRQFNHITRAYRSDVYKGFKKLLQ